MLALQAVVQKLVLVGSVTAMSSLLLPLARLMQQDAAQVLSALASMQVKMPGRAVVLW